MPQVRDSQDLIRELLVRELETVNLYTTMTANARTAEIREMLARITEEEKHHIAEAMDLLARFDPGQAGALRASGVQMHHGERTHEVEPAAPTSTAPVTFEPSGAVAEALPDQTLLQVVKDAGIAIRNVCGGKGQCGTCRIEILTGDHVCSPVTDPEQRWLEDLLDQGWRLSCQTRVFGPVRVRVPKVEKASIVGGSE